MWYDRGMTPTAEQPKPLQGKQAAFVDFYLGQARFNATEAARLAGYASTGNALRVVASRLLTLVNVQAAIQARLAERAMNADECLARVAEQARGSLEDFIDVGEVPAENAEEWCIRLTAILESKQAAIDAGDFHGWTERLQKFLEKDVPVVPWRLNLARAKELGLLHLVHKVSYDRHGRPTIELYNAQQALQMIGNHHRLFVQRQEHSGLNGERLQIEVKPVDYRVAIAPLLDAAPLTTGPEPDSMSSGEGQMPGDGETLG